MIDAVMGMRLWRADWGDNNDGEVQVQALNSSYVLVPTPRSSVGSTPFAEAQHPFTSGSFSHMG